MNASASGFTPVRQLTLPMIKFNKNASKYLKFNEVMHAGSVLKGSGERAKAVPATLANVTDLQSGTVLQFVVPPSVEAAIKSGYTGDGYVGLCFEIKKHNRREEKGFPDYSVTEVKEPSQDIKAPKK